MAADWLAILSSVANKTKVVFHAFSWQIVAHYTRAFFLCKSKNATFCDFAIDWLGNCRVVQLKRFIFPQKGGDIVKVFPAAILGPDYVRALLSVLPPPTA